MSDRRVLAVIPARGGSKRVPRKNIRPVGGKPLIAHTIADADEATRVDRAVVSTDDRQIAAIARQHDGYVPFMRPEELATDTASATDVITHALRWAQQELGDFDVICSLQVTSPLRTPADIDGALDRLSESNADSCVSVSEYITPPQWAVTPETDDSLQPAFASNPLWSEDDTTRSQDMPELLHPNGAVFAATTTAWQSYESFYTPQTVGYQMPPRRSFDIDEPWELELIRTLFEHSNDRN